MAEHSYWEQIERYFMEKRGNALILSPKDWPLLTSWQERNIPLEVIFEGIDRAFERREEKQAGRQPQPIRSLSFCKRDVEQIWKDREESRQPAAAEPGSSEILASECRKLVIKLRSTATQLQKYATQPHYHCIEHELIATAEMLDSMIVLIEETEEIDALTAIKDRLRDLEQRLMTQLEQSLAPNVSDKLYASAEARVKSHKHHMADAVYQETLRLAFLQELRANYPLPSFI